jgi:hypothetical protein
MRGKWLAVLILVLAGCSGGDTNPAGQASNTRIPSPVSASPSPGVWPATLPLTTVDFHCSLPAYARVGTRLTDSFVAFPARAKKPAGIGGYYYDQAVLRWLPVHREAISPDGRRYAYTEGWSATPPAGPRVHIVDAATGANVRVVTMPQAQPYVVVDFTNSAVYLMIRYESTPPGVWKVDLGTGAVTKVSNGFYVPAGPAWIGVVDSRDPHPFQSQFNGEVGTNRIDRRDATGHLATWFYRPGHALTWVAFIASPALLVGALWQGADPRVGGYEYWVVTGPNQATLLTSYSNGQPSAYLDLNNGFGSAIADTHGIWIGGEQSLYLVAPSGGIRRVYDQSAYPANGCF